MLWHIYLLWTSSTWSDILIIYPILFIARKIHCFAAIFSSGTTCNPPLENTVWHYQRTFKRKVLFWFVFLICGVVLHKYARWNDFIFTAVANDGKEYSTRSYINSLAASGNAPEPLSSRQSNLKPKSKCKYLVTEDVTLTQSTEARTWKMDAERLTSRFLFPRVLWWNCLISFLKGRYS